MTGWYTEVHRKSVGARLLRSHLIARKGMVDMQRQQSHRIRGLLRAHGIVLGRVASGEFERRVIKQLERRCAGLLPAIRPLLENWVSVRRSVAETTRQLKRLSAWHAVAGAGGQQLCQW